VLNALGHPISSRRRRALTPRQAAVATPPIVEEFRSPITVPVSCPRHVDTDRAPVILPPAFRDHWLDPTLTSKDDVNALLASIPEPHLNAYEVSTTVNSPRNNTPDLLTPVP
jgi:SOS response associated peptidase (SRAP)